MELIERPLYLNRLQKLRGSDEIKILLGMRGVGKTSLLDLFFRQLLSSGVKRENIVRMDLDNLAFMKLNSEEDFYNLLALQMSDDAKTFLLLDEVQRIKNWQAVVVKLKENFSTDIYIAVSSDFDKNFFNPPPIILNILPLSFKEFQRFAKFPDDFNLSERWKIYLQTGGFPAVVQAFPNQSQTAAALLNIFSSAIIRDGFGTEKFSLDVNFSVDVAKKLSSLCAEVTSLTGIANLFENESRQPVPRTIEKYIEQLCRAKMFYSVPIFSKQDKIFLDRYAKYYPVDLGLKNFLSGETPFSQEILETLIYHELLRLDVKVSVYRVKKFFLLQIDREEVGERIYINPIKNLNTEEEKKSAYRPFRLVKDFFAKWIVTAEENVSNSPNGIKVTNIIDFLMSE